MGLHVLHLLAICLFDFRHTYCLLQLVAVHRLTPNVKTHVNWKKGRDIKFPRVEYILSHIAVYDCQLDWQPRTQASSHVFRTTVSGNPLQHDTVLFLPVVSLPVSIPSFSSETRVQFITCIHTHTYIHIYICIIYIYIYTYACACSLAYLSAHICRHA